MEYYGRRIPWAGRIILGLGEQAKFHPRVTRVLGLIEPRGLRLENRLPRPVDRQVTSMSSAEGNYAKWVAPHEHF